MNEFILEFEKIVEKFPDNFAIVENGNKKITYKELSEYAQTIASNLQNKGVKKGQIVAINIDKSIDYIASILAIWSIKAVFMPLSPSLPEDRKDFILEDSKTDFIVKKEVSELEIQKYKEHGNQPFNQKPAYLIYTSGSTGNPKGVLVSHRGIVNIIKQQVKFFHIDENSKLLFLLSTSFDASLSDIGTSLLAGASIYIEMKNIGDIVINISNIIKDRKITYIDIPPSVLSVLDVDDIGDTLETLVIGGELANIQTIRKWSSKINLINVYGPTEATICTSMVVCDSDFVEGDIGNVVEGIKYKLQPTNLNQSPKPEQGELLIGGIGLAIGYRNNKKLNQEKFVMIDGERFYKTGDLVEKKDGKYIFKGRLDRQLKIRGQLVELEEVESVIKSYLDVSNAAVIAQETANRKKLIAFVQTKKDLDIEKLKIYMGNKLTDWMIPSEFVLIDKLPVNVNGKIDYGELKNQENQINENQTAKTHPQTQLIQMWKDILDVENVGLDDDFFQLGGDSLATIEMITKAVNIGINLPISVVAKEKTIRKILEYHENNKNGTDGMKAEELEKKIPELEREILELSTINTVNPTFEDLQGPEIAFFLTGGTGFLGVRLLKKLLKNHKNSSFYILLRGENSIAAKNRLISIAQDNGVDITQKELQRVYILCGDIGLPKFGLLDEVWDMLLNNITDIVHLAAEVNMVKTYEQLEKINVGGTIEVIKLALTGKRKNIHYASTLSVFVATDQNTGTVYEDDNLTNMKVVYGGYAQTKWLAEKSLLQFREKLSINIFRYGLLTGDSKTGMSASHDFLSMFVQGLISIGSIPKAKYDQLFLDVTPIDYACDVTAKLIISKQFKTFHIANTKGFSLAQILDGLKKMGITIASLDSSDWLQYIKNMDLSPGQSATIMGLCRLLPDSAEFQRLRSMDLFQGTDIVFDRKNTLDLAGEIDIVNADNSLLLLYLNKFI